MADIPAITIELTDGHPDQGAYSADDAEATDQLNAVGAYTAWLRDAAPEEAEMRDYCIRTKFRTRTLLGAITMVAEAPLEHWAYDGSAWVRTPSILPFGGSGSDITLADEHICSAKAFLALLEYGSVKPLTNAELDSILDNLGLGGGCHCMDGTIKSALQALSQSKQSRAQELSLGRVLVSHVTAARPV